jgi:hypothetical protein
MTEGGHGYSRMKHGFRMLGSGIFRAFFPKRAQSAKDPLIRVQSVFIRGPLFPQLAQ